MRLAFEFRRCRSCAGKKIIGGNIFDLFASVPLFLTHVNRNVKPSWNQLEFPFLSLGPL